MSIFPDWLYKLTPRDEQVTPLEFVTHYFFNTTAAAQVTATDTYTVPAGKILAPTNIGMALYPGAAQKPMESYIYSKYDAAGSDLLYHWAKKYDPNAAARFNLASNDLPLLIPSGTVLFAVAEFSAGVNANSFEGHIQGVLIPRGNFAI